MDSLDPRKKEGGGFLLKTQNWQAWRKEKGRIGQTRGGKLSTYKRRKAPLLGKSLTKKRNDASGQKHTWGEAG